jgi:hypothetical protein
LRKTVARADSQMIAKTEELSDTDAKNKVIVEKAGGDLFGKLIALENAKRNTKTESDTLSNGAIFTVASHEKIMMRNISWAIMAFFFILEICPILVKIITDRGIYEDLLEAEATDIKEDLKLKNERKRNQIKHQIDLDKEQTGNSFDIDIQAEEEIQREIAEARKDIAREVVRKWKEREQRELNENVDAYLDKVVQ